MVRFVIRGMAAAILLGSTILSTAPAHADAVSCVASPTEPTTFNVDVVTFLRARSQAVCSQKVLELTSFARLEEHLFGPVWKARGATGADGSTDCQRYWATSDAECMDGTFRTEGRATAVRYADDTGDVHDESLSGNRDFDCPIPIKPDGEE